MGTGPRITSGFDIALTEVLEPGRHVFVARSGSARGKDFLDQTGAVSAPKALAEAANAAVRQAEEQQTRSIDMKGMRDAIYASFEDPRWSEGATDCFACGNCTQVCPTCFCTTVEDTSNVRQSEAERWRRWDSCFTESFSYIHGGSIRLTRYRQRVIHKFAAWEDQFGTPGCVGCGRCTTWCPAGIDVIRELTAIRGVRPAGMRDEEAGNGIN
jgi:formate hydrogenlyase subunit 6/NADH:ubiquinone oxidoreductase subunit I